MTTLILSVAFLWSVVDVDGFSAAKDLMVFLYYVLLSFESVLLCIFVYIRLFRV
jgi:hypothetical protein